MSTAEIQILNEDMIVAVVIFIVSFPSRAKTELNKLACSQCMGLHIFIYLFIYLIYPEVQQKLQ